MVGDRRRNPHIRREILLSSSGFDDFWISGGDCDTEGNYWTGDWIIDVAALPEQYRKYADEICYVFNENVRHGCCGGCT